MEITQEEYKNLVEENILKVKQSVCKDIIASSAFWTIWQRNRNIARNLIAWYTIPGN